MVRCCFTPLRVVHNTQAVHCDAFGLCRLLVACGGPCKGRDCACGLRKPGVKNMVADEHNFVARWVWPLGRKCLCVSRDEGNRGLRTMYVPHQGMYVTGPRSYASLMHVMVILDQGLIMLSSAGPCTWHRIFERIDTWWGLRNVSQHTCGF